MYTTDTPFQSFCEESYLSNKVVTKQNFLETVKVTPIAQSHWERKYNHVGFAPNWESIWNLAILVCKEARIRTQQWKVLHNIWPTNVLLRKMHKVDSEMCGYCRDEIDCIEHFFFKCKEVRSLWKNIEMLCSKIEGNVVKLNERDVLFGYNFSRGQENVMQNKLILIGKLCISKFKFGKYPNLVFLFEAECVLRDIVV